MQVHSTGIVQIGDIYYAIGENKTVVNGNLTTGRLFQFVDCYKPRDFVNWEFVNNLLTDTNGDADLSPESAIERSKITWNAKTKKWIMWMHVDKPATHSTPLKNRSLVIRR